MKLVSTILASAALVLATSPAAMAAENWISSTGKTHNASCRYYKTCKGFSSKKGSGDNCKICGGAKAS